MPIDPDNLAHWNAVTPHHVVSPAYRTADLLAGEDVLDPIAGAAVGDVRGARLLHLQCHFGLDTLSLARRGAEVTGLDFSAPALGEARRLAAATGLDGRFIEADVLDPPPLEGFDVVFASWGAIYWIGDIGRWMQVAAGALRPGGRLVLCEGHPALLMLDERAPAATLRVAWPWHSRIPNVEEEEVDYAGARVAARRTVGYFHGLGAILGGALAAGLSIERFEEHDRVPWRALDAMVEVDDRYWALPPACPYVPASFTLVARRLEARGTP